MAITIWKPREAAPPLSQTFAIDPVLLQTRAAQEARRRGVLLAKQQALRAAEGLLAWGRLLGWAIIFVSAIHIWETVASIAPSDVGQLRLPGLIYHLAALAFTLMIDAVALFVSRANAVAALAGASASRWTLYFYAVTALLNAAFVASHAPALDVATRAAILPRLGALFVVILPVSVPAGIVAVETSRRTLEVCQLALLAEVATLRELDATGRADMVGRQKTAGPDLATGGPPADAPAPTVAPTSGGRPQQFRIEDLVARLGGQASFSPAQAQRALGASESSVRRLLAEGLEHGLIIRRGVGAYAVVDTPRP